MELCSPLNLEIRVKSRRIAVVHSIKQLSEGFGCRMCGVMSAADYPCDGVTSGVTRRDLFKRLLSGSSPKNPTYILGRVIANFTAQSLTELTVVRGEEIFILFEIKEWAFATVFTDSARQGYVPLDYCELVTDFYEHTAPGQAQPNSRNYIRKDKVNPSNGKHHQQAERSRKGLYDELVYYETKHKQNDSSRVVAQRGDDQYRYPNPPQGPNKSTFNSDFGELYQEDMTPKKSSRWYEETAPVLSRGRTQCCCCCDNRRCRSRSRHEGYHNVLHYLHEAEISASHYDDTESGLGDSESILSCDLPPFSANTTKTDFDLNDMSTQTSKSLEDLYGDKNDLPSRPKLVQTSSKEKSFETARILYSHSTSPTSSSSPSVDSFLSDSVFASSPRKESKVDSDEGSISSFEREDFATVKRRQQPILDDSCDRELALAMERSKLENTAKNSKVDRYSSSEQAAAPSRASVKSRLALPILENGKKPNRVELTRLSLRIKEKLKPARDELLSKRAEEKKVVVSANAAQESDLPGSNARIISDETADLPSSQTANNNNMSSKVSNIDIKKREATLQSIQEQYMKLEEARLLYNAIKQLEVITPSEDKD